MTDNHTSPTATEQWRTHWPFTRASPELIRQVQREEYKQPKNHDLITEVGEALL